MGGEITVRKENWPSILNDVIESFKDKPFVWGDTDCMQFSLKCAAALLKRDIYEQDEERFHYSSKEEIQGVLEHFGGNVRGVFDFLFERHSAMGFASRGDIVLLNWRDEELAGIICCNGRKVAVKGEEGIYYLPLKHAVEAWKVN